VLDLESRRRVRAKKLIRIIGRSLKQYGELPESAKINEAEADEGDDAAVEFAEGSDDEDDDDDLDDL
jgi:hypothetical protein